MKEALNCFPKPGPGCGPCSSLRAYPYANSCASRYNPNPCSNTTWERCRKCNCNCYCATSYSNGLLMVPMGFGAFPGEHDSITYQKLLRERHGLVH